MPTALPHAQDEDGDYDAGQLSDNSGKHCNCKKSRCLKLYCECFSAGAFPGFHLLAAGGSR